MGYSPSPVNTGSPIRLLLSKAQTRTNFAYALIMRPEQWETFKRAARLEKLEKIPMALIIDSPWIPGYLGIQHMDYFLDPELWFQSNLKIMREFPDIIFVPSWWMEYGMAAEPSVPGAKIKFWQDNTPSE